MHRPVLAAALTLTLIACGGTDPDSLTDDGAAEVQRKAADAGTADSGAPQPQECTPGQVANCDCIPEGNEYPDGGFEWQACAQEVCNDQGQWGYCEGGTPIVLSFDGSPVMMSPAPGHFDLGQGSLATTDWPSAVTPWLVLDRDGDGQVGDGSELFGSMTRLNGGAKAQNGFEALAELDSNHDGLIDARDPAWANLRLWSDGDSDRRVGPGELATLSSMGVESIALSTRDIPRCDRRGNCEVERAAMIWRDSRGCQREGAAIDVHVRFRAAAIAVR